MFTICRCQDVDPALLRRFDRRVEVPLPDAAGRAAFLRGVLAAPEMEGHGLEPDEVARLVELTEGAFVGANAATVHARLCGAGHWLGVRVASCAGNRGACCWSCLVYADVMACGCRPMCHARKRDCARTTSGYQQGTELRRPYDVR